MADYLVSSAVTLAARLKTHGVESIMLKRNPRVGDNWALRYENLAFHVPTSMCDMPYMRKSCLSFSNVQKSGLS